MNYEIFIPIAKEVASRSPWRKTKRHVSIIVSGKSIIAIGENGRKTHTLAKQSGYRHYSVHSEIDAYSKVRYRNQKMTLLNFRFNRAGQLRNSRPCDICMAWCLEVFDEIWYSTEKGMVKV